ncbi:hypothetical protein GPAL_1005 [Glaciecola pallidula DSM 14239 = ACAM 615]|uniref:Uncharacterized protein n=1 Tax=Brumicola pallidula DSM 14239 = ACAM 615 TaxID=1121922 RepID=K6Y529_9ALTE|nr:hypothetical protein GPAL_1005 [Glaciecola pallidula DSM 14239 = ACAM 615]
MFRQSVLKNSLVFAVQRVCNSANQPRSFIVNMSVWFVILVAFMFLF